jgi:hypothetical protein
MIEVTKGLSSTDRLELESYAFQKDMKRQWQEEGNGELSYASDRHMSTALSNMSEAAKKIADQYANYHQKLLDYRERLENLK